MTPFAGKAVVVTGGSRGIGRATDRIRVNCVAPTVTAADMAAALWPGKAGARMVEQLPMGRYVEPREVADAIVFLAGPGASYITGECLNIMGGF